MKHRLATRSNRIVILIEIKWVSAFFNQLHSVCITAQPADLTHWENKLWALLCPLFGFTELCWQVYDLHRADAYQPRDVEVWKDYLEKKNKTCKIDFPFSRKVISAPRRASQLSNSLYASLPVTSYNFKSLKSSNVIGSESDECWLSPAACGTFWLQGISLEKVTAERGRSKLSARS